MGKNTAGVRRKDFNSVCARGRQKRVQINSINVINVVIRSGT